MESLSIMSMVNYHPSPHIKYSPARRQMTAAAMMRKPSVTAATVSNDYCHQMLPKLSTNFTAIIQQISQPELRDSNCNLYLFLNSLDTIEDDMELPAEDKIPLLRNFYRCVYDRDYKFICGTGTDRELMQGHQHVHTAFMDLETSCQEIIMETLKKMGEGMAEFIPREIDTMSDYEEYIDYVNTIYLSATVRLANAVTGQNLPDESLTRSVAFMHQKNHNIIGFYEDVTDLPKRKMYVPKETWSKYANNVEELLEEVNAVKAGQFQNEMVTDALRHAEDCLDFTSLFQEPSVFRFYAIPRVVFFGELALCYDNHQVFEKQVKLGPDVKARIFEVIKTMADVYGAYYDIACLFMFKVNKNDPRAAETLSRLEAIKRKCMDSGILNQRTVIFQGIQAIM